MYKFKTEQVLEPQFLTKLVDMFLNREVKKFKKLDRYYKAQNDILNRTMESGKPNNRLAHSFCRYITNMATSYFLGKPVQYNVENPEYREALEKIQKKNYINSLNFELSKEASKKGISFEIMFINEAGKLEEQKLNAEEVIPVYSPKLGEFLECAVRIWNTYDIDGVLKKQSAEVYTKEDIVTFEREAIGAEFKLVDAEAHKFSDIPVIVVHNNEELMGDYEPVISSVDAYDKAMSDTANDSEYFADAYLCIAGAGGGLEDGAADEDEDSDHAAYSLRKNRLLLLDEKGQAEWLTKNTNDVAQENYKSRLKNDIFFLSQVPALSDESFAGNLTGVAIKYKLIGLEELTIMKESKFEAALHKRDKLVTEYLNMTMNQKWDAGEIDHKYERNFIENESDLITDSRNLEGVVSKRTQLRRLPTSIVENVDEELEQLETEKLQDEGFLEVEV